MPSQKRERQRENRAAAAAAQAAAVQAQRRKRSSVLIAVVAVAVAALVFLVTRGDGAKAKKPDTAASPSTTGGSATTLAASAASCPPADGSAPRTTTFAAPPPTCIDAAKRYRAVIDTSKGAFTVALDSQAAPATVNNFVVLARHHYYDGVVFHRVIPGFVVQGGDPKGDGTGGPGYRFADELPPAGAYKVGSLAMANSGPDTNGSQFFVVTGDQGVALPPNYSLFGQVVAGMDTVKAIEAVGTESGEPKEKVAIRSVVVTED